MAIRPPGNTFLFAFLNETVAGLFAAKTAGKIIIADPSNARLRMNDNR